jgi:hypothetical protein
MDMGFAGLHQLLVPFLGGLEGLPAPQRQALGSAFGLVAGPPPDRFLVGMAALTVLTDAAAARPVLCLIDDAQWLNRVSIEVLGFVARRLYADRVGMVFATRTRKEEERAVVLAGLSELTVGGLSEEAAHELLATSAGAVSRGRMPGPLGLDNCRGRGGMRRRGGVRLYGERKRFRFRAADAAAERDGNSCLRAATRSPKE